MSFVPRPFTTVMMAMEMPAAISPYSMAVAPDWSLRKALIAAMAQIMARVREASIKSISENRPQRLITRKERAMKLAGTIHRINSENITGAIYPMNAAIRRASCRTFRPDGFQGYLR